MLDHRAHGWQRLRAALLAVVIFLSQVFSLVPFAVQAAAGVPNVITYQGRLKNASGVALSGTYDFIFGFYDAATAGTLLATETQSNVTVSDGYFSVNLDIDGDIADFANLLYLDIQVKEDSAVGYDTMSSRVSVNSTPYALFARAIENAAAAPATNLFAGRTYFNTVSGKMYVYDGSTWNEIMAGTAGSLDGGYNAFGATAAKVNVDAAEGQTGGLEFESNITGNIIFDLQNTGDLVVQDAGTIFATFSDTGLFSVNGNVDLGDSAADTVTFAGVVDSNIVANDNTHNLGSASTRWATGYFDTVDATSISGTVTGGSTTSSAWTVNSDNVTTNGEIGSLAFERGSPVINAVMQWNASGDAGRVTGFDDNFLFNFPIAIYSQVSGLNTTFTSGNVYAFAQPAAHAITQTGALTGVSLDMSSNVTVPDSSSGNQTGVSVTLADGGTSATATGVFIGGSLDRGIDFSSSTLSGGGAHIYNDTGLTMDLTNGADTTFTLQNSGAGLANLTMDGNFSQTGATTFSTGTSTVSLNGATTVANGNVFTANGGVVLGDNGDTVVVNSSDWDIDATGAITGVAFDANGSGNSLSNVDNADLTNDTIDFDKMVDAGALDAAWSVTGTAGEMITFARTLTDATAENGATMNFTASDITVATSSQFGLYLDNLASTEGLDASLVIDNSDADDAVVAAIKIVNAGGGFTTLIDNEGTLISGTELNLLDGGITNNELTDTGTLTVTTVDINGGAIDGTAIGATSASTGVFTTLSSTGVTALGNNSATVAIDSSDWDISATGVMTGIGALTMDGAFSQTGATTFSTGTGTVSLNGATTVANANIFTANGGVALGDNGDTVVIDSSDWDISATGAMTGIGAITADGLITGTSGLTLTGVTAIAIGNNLSTVAIDSSDWDIDATGAMTGVGALTMDGAFSQTGATTFSTGTSTVSLNGATTVANGNVFTANGGVVLGDNGDTVVVNSSDWDIDATGAITGVAFDANGTGNSLSNVDNADLTNDTIDFDKMVDAGALDSAWSVTGTAGETITFARTLTDATAENGTTMNFTASDTTVATTSQFGLYLDNLASTEGLDASLVIDNSDIDDVVGAAIKIVDAGGGFTNIIDNAGTLISGAELNVLDGGIALSELSDSGTLTATTVDVNGGAIDGTTIGASSASSGAFTTLLSTGITALGNNSATVAINSSDWDISATGAMTGIGAITADGVISTTSTLSVTGNGQFGTNVTSLTTTPLNVSFGGTYGSNTPGSQANLKWDMYNSSGSNRYGIGMSTGLMEFQAGSSSDGNFAWWTGSATERMRLTSGGNLGIGDSSPAAMFTVGSGDLFQVNSSGAIAASTGYTQTSGNFAISGTGTFGTGTGAISLNGATTVANGNVLTANGGVVLGDSGDTVVIDSSDWDISATGNASGLGTIAADGNMTLSSGASISLTGGSSSGQGNIQMGATASNLYDTNLLYLGSTANTGGYVFGSTPAGLGANGPYFIGRGNTYSAIAGQRGNMLISAGNPSVPASTEGMIGFYTNDVERLKIATGGAITMSSAATASSTFTTNGTMTFGDGGDTAAINSSDWDISTTGAMTGIGAITADGLFTGTGGMTLTGATAIAIGNNLSTVAIDSSDWDISTTGAMTGIGALTMDGAFSQTGATTFSTGTGAISLNGATTIATGNTFTANGTLVLGDGGDTAAIDSSDWDISSTGVMTGIGAITADGAVTTSSGGISATSSSGDNYIQVSRATQAQGEVGYRVNGGTGGKDWYMYQPPSSDELRFYTTGVGYGDMFKIGAEGELTVLGSPTATTAITITDTDFTNSLSIGDNNILGTTALIDFTNFDVSAAGLITVANGQGLDSGGALYIGSGAGTTSTYICQSASCDNVLIGSNSDADTITIGDVAGADTTTLNGSTVAIDSADWDITTTGAMTGIGALTMDGNFSQTGATTFSTGTGTVALNGDVTIATGKRFNMADTTAPIMTIINTSTFSLTDGTNNLLTVADAGTNGTVTITGNLVGGSAATVGTTTLDIGGTGTGNAVCHSGAAATTDNVGIVDCTTAPAADYAERYPIATGITYGEIVTLGSQEVITNDGDRILQLVRSSAAYQEPIVGIVSDNYGDFTSAGNNIAAADNPMPIALVGRVPVMVTNEGGEIHPGDFIATSSTAGKGMKATRAGRVIGMALGTFTGTSGSVMVQVINTWYQPSTAASSPLQGTANTGTLLSSGTVQADTLLVLGDASFKGSVTVMERLYAGKDVAGRARIKAGSDQVRVSFAHTYTSVPIVNATLRTPGEMLASWWVEGESYDGFTIKLDRMLNADVEFNWLGVGTYDGVVTISDGTTTPLVNNGQVAGDSTTAAVTSPMPAVDPLVTTDTATPTVPDPTITDSTVTDPTLVTDPVLTAPAPDPTATVTSTEPIVDPLVTTDTATPTVTDPVLTAPAPDPTLIDPPLATP